MMRLTVCELKNTPEGLKQDWDRLIAYLKTANSDLLLLPEMTFSPWLAETNEVDTAKWDASVKEHDTWIKRFADLTVGAIVGTKPVNKDGNRYNEGFIWTHDAGYRAVHQKVNLPDEAGWWEASWYNKGTNDFKVIRVEDANIGFLICSELWFNEHAREYMKQNVDILVTPRATPAASVEKWITAGKTAAIVAGAYSLSSNFSESKGTTMDWGGVGWIIEPGDGEVLARTSSAEPFQTMEIDLNLSRQAKNSYPRNVKE